MKENDRTDTSRRAVLKASYGISSISLASAAVSADTGSNSSERKRSEAEISTEARNRPVEDIAFEFREHPDQPLAAFSTTFLGDGYQLYIVRGENKGNRIAKHATPVTEAEAGVHGISWTDSTKNGTPVLRYSEDGATFEGRISGTDLIETRRVSDDPIVPEEPMLKASSTGISTQTRRVNYCVDPPLVDEWCANARGPETGRLKCKSQSGGHTPPIEHYQFEILRSGDATSGVSFWTGQQTTDSCTWVGEENYSEWCWKYCKGDGVPGVSALAGAIEDAINKAADHANVAIPAAVVTAIAYAIATGIVVKPPTGVPA